MVTGFGPGTSTLFLILCVFSLELAFQAPRCLLAAKVAGHLAQGTLMEGIIHCIPLQRLTFSQEASLSLSNPLKAYKENGTFAIV